MQSALGLLQMIQKGLMFSALIFVAMHGAQKKLIEDFPVDRAADEVLEEVAQTRKEMLYKVAGIKTPREKDEREGFYGRMNVGVAHTPGLGISTLMGIELGHDWIVGSRHSLRLFGFFDRTNHGGFADLETDSTKANVMQIYRAGLSFEYRIYASSYVGFMLRLASLGAYSLSRTDSSVSPQLTLVRKSWLYPTFAFGPIFTYGKNHEAFVGFDLLDYELARGMSVNYLKYSYRF